MRRSQRSDTTYKELKLNPGDPAGEEDEGSDTTYKELKPCSNGHHGRDKEVPILPIRN